MSLRQAGLEAWWGDTGHASYLRVGQCGCCPCRVTGWRRVGPYQQTFQPTLRGISSLSWAPALGNLATCFLLVEAGPSDDMVHLLLPNPPKVWPIVRATCRKGNARMGTASLTPSFQLGPPLSFRPLLVRTAFSFFGSQPSLGAISARQAFFGAVLIVGMAALATTVWFCPGAGGDLCILTGSSGVL